MREGRNIQERKLFHNFLYAIITNQSLSLTKEIDVKNFFARLEMFVKMFQRD